MRDSGMPDVDRLLLRESLIDPVDPDEVTQFFETGAE